MFTENGKQYAGIQFYFIVFPYKVGTYTLPGIPISLHTPPPGSGTSQSITIRTSPRSLTVKPVPAGEKENWLVAKNISISQTWNHPADTLKVGDIVKRTVTIDAYGTLPQFIPPLQKTALGFAGTYLQDAKLNDLRTDYDANGRLTQSIVYLLEKPGLFSIPAIKIDLWNPVSNKWYTRTAPARTVSVLPNPNLGMLTTLKDSLDAQQHPAIAQSRPPFTRFWPAALILLIALYLGYMLARRLPTYISRFKARRAARLAGEAWAFRRFMRSPLDTRSLTRSLYHWFDRIHRPGTSFALMDCLQSPQRAGLREEIASNLHTLYTTGATSTRTNRALKKETRAWRKEIRTQKIHREKQLVSPLQQTL